MHSPAAAALRATLPVLFGYVPLGIAFGLLFNTLGHPWYFAPLMGIFIFAGAAQFLAVGLLSAHAGLLEVAVTTFLLNSRHMFFGLSLLGRFRVPGLRRLYLIFGLTDETYSLLTGTKPPEGVKRADYDLWVTGLNQLWWVTGCTLGALLGQAVAFDLTGLDFTLTALFMVLVIEQYRATRALLPFLVALACGLLALALFDHRHMLLLAIALATSLLIADGKRRQWTTPST